MYIEHSKLRQTVHPDQRNHYASKGQKNVQSQMHISDYYALTDAHKKKVQKKSIKSKSKSKSKKKQKWRNKTQNFSVGSAQDHTTSIQKLQLSLGDKSKQQITLMVEIQKMKNENNLMLLQILTPRDQKQAQYIKELEEKQQRLKLLDFINEDSWKKMENTLNKLEKEKKKLQKELQKLQETEIMRR